MTPEELAIFTYDELIAILDGFWDKTGEWDPLVNKKLDALYAEQRKLQAKRPTKAVTASLKTIEHQLESLWDEHRYFVGQRGAIQHMKSLLSQEIVTRKGLLPQGRLNDCCIRYLKAIEPDVYAENRQFWSEMWEKLSGPALPFEAVERTANEEREAIRQQVKLGTYRGIDNRPQCCPWDERYADGWLKSYQAVSSHLQAGGTIAVGPIEVVEEHPLR